jgi:hypothetical protein
MLTKDDITIMIFAYRYAICRKTYAFDMVCEYIIDKVPEMNSQQIEEVANEVKRSVRFHHYADTAALFKAIELLDGLRYNDICVRNWYFDDEGEQIWALVVHNGRYCYWGCKTESVFGHTVNCDSALGNKLLLAKILHDGFDPDSLPHIEDVSPAMQRLWRDITDSDNNMWFVEDEEESWNELGLTKEEYQRQVDADIKKYRLEDVIEKYEDEDTLYTCYGDLQSRFSGKDTNIERGI